MSLVLGLPAFFGDAVFFLDADCFFGSRLDAGRSSPSDGAKIQLPLHAQPAEGANTIVLLKLQEREKRREPVEFWSQWFSGAAE